VNAFWKQLLAGTALWWAFFPGMPAHSQVDQPASAVHLYWSAYNDPLHLSGPAAPGFFMAGSYSKNYAEVTLIYFDVSSVVPDLLAAGQLYLSTKFLSVTGAPRPLNIDYLGTVSDTQTSLQRYLTPSLENYAQVMTNTAAPGLHPFDVTTIQENSFSQQYAVFRLYQTGYVIGDSANNEYRFSSTLTDIRLTSSAPEPVSTSLLAFGAALLLAQYRRSGSRL
jgi:hypothetical protein